MLKYFTIIPFSENKKTGFGEDRIHIEERVKTALISEIENDIFGK